MPGTLLVGLLALVIGIGGAVVVLAAMRADRQAVSRSLAAVGGMRLAQPVSVPPPTGVLERVLVPLLLRLAQVARRLSPAGVEDALQRRLDLAGNPAGWDVQRVLGAKGLGLLVGGSFGFWFGNGGGLLRGLLYAAACGAACFFLPNVLLYNSGQKRQEQIQKTLADALDLLTISVEAGLGFDAAVAQVAKNTDGPLAGEFFRLLQEMQIGKTRAAAFRALSDRSDVADLRGFTSSIVQADSLGIPIANVLREQAKEMRLKRMQRAEEKAMKVPVKILFPTVLFILPALFVVIIGPGGLAIVKVLGG